MQKRNLQLDFLRFVAIFGVLIAHATIFRSPTAWWDKLATRPSWSGVDLFFVISGFLISGLLFSEFQKRGRIDFLRFAVRRGFKLYPALYVVVFSMLFYRLFANGFHAESWILSAVLHDIFFLQSYLPGTYGHFWSLAVEEHFYILLPVTLYLMLRKASSGEKDPFRKLPAIVLVIVVVSLGVRLIEAFLIKPYDDLIHLFPTHLRLDSLAFGVLLSYWHHFHSEKFRAVINRMRPVLPVIALVLIAPALVWDRPRFFIYTFGLSSLYLGYGALMLALLQIPLAKESLLFRLLAPFAYIGQYSYSIYLTHRWTLDQLLDHDLLVGWRGVILYFICTITAGVLFSKLIEYPALRLRDKIFPAGATPTLPGAALETSSYPEARRSVSA